MAKFSTTQHSFLAGELGPEVRARLDVDQYKQGASKVIDFIPRPWGGAYYRAGLKYLQTLVLTDTADKLFGFTYRAETGNDFEVVIDYNHATAASRLRVYDKDGVLQTITGTFGSPYGQLSNAINAVASWGDFQGFRTAQKGSLCFITHVSGDMAPLILYRVGALWYFAEYGSAITNIPGNQLDLVLQFPFGAENSSATTMTASAATGAITITASAATFTANDVGNLIRIRNGATEGISRITGFTSTTLVNATVIVGPSPTAAVSTWRFEAWRNSYPKFVFIFEQRLGFACSTDFPDEVWVSKIGNMLLMMQDKMAQDSATDVTGLHYFGAKDDTDPFSFFPDNVGVISWITSGQSLHIGSFEGEWTADGSGGKFSFRAINVKQQTNYGGSVRSSVRVLNSTFYISADGKSVREFTYSEANGSYINRNVSNLNQDILEHGYDVDSTSSSMSTVQYRQLVWDASLNVLWALLGQDTSIGVGGSPMKVVGFAYENSTGLSGWFRFNPTNARIHCLWAANKTVYMAVERTINAGVVYYLERLGKMVRTKNLTRRTGDSADDRPNYLDCHRRNLVASTVTHTGFTHLPSTEVSVIADGSYIGEKTVSAGGVITLDTAATEVIAGFKYTGKIKSMNLDSGSIIGNAQTLYKKIHKLIVMLFRSSGGKFGISEENPYPIEYPDSDDELYTGDSKDLEFDSTPGSEQAYWIIQDEPYPLNILGVSMKGSAED